VAPVHAALTDVADSLAAHFAEWGAKSRFASDGAGRAEPAAAPADGRAAKRAASLARAVSAAQATTPAAKRLVRLFNDALALPPEPRLVESVLHPIAEAITGKRLRGRAKPQQGGGTDLADAGGQLWALAQAATKERSRWKGEPEQLTLLMEATAALQDLALRASPDSQRAKRLAELRKLQADCKQGIRCAHNGPYLVTNVGRVRDWLGAEIPTTPQTALCRCGESRVKPVCDGACATNSFSDKKDPKRVPDRRDTYDGVQLTVYDNRGICQHSGFCTDRLNTVFHTEGTFVTPSGGRMDEIIRAVRDCPSGALSYAIDGLEARSQVDWDGGREPSIEVTKDGAYRATGGIPLSDHRGEPVKRAAGSSLEHYALCRCGHSQNKPFCSGMHWYIEFRDPVTEPDREPTMFEWCGGLPALTRMTRLFYERHVPEDPLLAPLFATMAPDHPERVARWLGEVFGGASLYSDSYGGYQRMLSQHLGKSLTEEMRARWVELLCRSAEEAASRPTPSSSRRSAPTSSGARGSRSRTHNRAPSRHGRCRCRIGAGAPPDRRDRGSRRSNRTPRATSPKSPCPPPARPSASTPTSSRCSASAIASR
jgi:CDGSH-type Zn-finger protein/truncated hemoglobin YjbI